MTVRILKTRYAVGDMVSMASRRVAGVVGNGAIADRAGKRIVEVRSRVGAGEKQAYDEAVVFELQVELEPFGGGSRPMIYARHRRTNAGSRSRSRLGFRVVADVGLDD